MHPSTEIHDPDAWHRCRFRARSAAAAVPMLQLRRRQRPPTAPGHPGKDFLEDPNHERPSLPGGCRLRPSLQHHPGPGARRAQRLAAGRGLPGRAGAGPPARSRTGWRCAVRLGQARPDPGRAGLAERPRPGRYRPDPRRFRPACWARPRRCRSGARPHAPPASARRTRPEAGPRGRPGAATAPAPPARDITRMHGRVGAPARLLRRSAPVCMRGCALPSGPPSPPPPRPSAWRWGCGRPSACSCCRSRPRRASRPPCSAPRWPSTTWSGACRSRSPARWPTATAPAG